MGVLHRFKCLEPDTESRQCINESTVVDSSGGVSSVKKFDRSGNFQGRQGFGKKCVCERVECK